MYHGWRVAAVIPAYNEERLIPRVLDGLTDVVDLAIVVDDCSTDGTTAKVEEWIRRTGDTRVHILRHERNQGVGAGIKAGYKRGMELGGDVLVVLAGDDQMDAQEIPKLLDPIVQGKADYTKGNRLYMRGSFAGMSNWRIFGNSILTLLTKISSGNWHITDPQNGYTAISREALERIGIDAVYPWYGYCNDILARCNAYDVRVKDIPIPARYGQEQSKIRYGRYIVRISALLWADFLWRMLVKYVARDFHPLVFFYLFSVPLILLGIGGGIFGVYAKFAYGIPLFQSLLTSLVVFSIGSQFLFFAMYFDMNEAKRVNQ